MVDAGLTFFFDMIKWVFNDFLIRVKILNIPVLYLLLAILLLGIVINGLLNTPTAGNFILSSSKDRKDKQ